MGNITDAAHDSVVGSADFVILHVDDDTGNDCDDDEKPIALNASAFSFSDFAIVTLVASFLLIQLLLFFFDRSPSIVPVTAWLFTLNKASLAT